MSEVFQYTESGYTFIDTATVLTPDQTELFLKLLHNELGKAQLAVKKTRDAELDAEEAYLKARLPLLAEEDCPDRERRSGRVTQKQVDAWFADRITAEHQALRRAQVDRRNAVSYAGVVKDQVQVMRSLNSLAKVFYEEHRGGPR
ncbi:hypothetical protein [Nonomuraea sp. NPDC048901]|uniref:hypothetical protein n=1 Tax=Nonomuraea sp. NPDC048901 TaxID=3155627 RepID=UPI0033D9DE1C